jgi:hypothetical protein
MPAVPPRVVVLTVYALADDIEGIARPAECS